MLPAVRSMLRFVVLPCTRVIRHIIGGSRLHGASLKGNLPGLQTWNKSADGEVGTPDQHLSPFFDTWSDINLDLPCIDGVYLSGLEHDFHLLVSAELDHFIQQGNHKAVLLLPPVSSRLRYLIHKITESFDALSSFSVGEGWQRRTVICHAGIRLPTQSEESGKNAPDKNYSRFWRGSHNKKPESGRGRQNWRQRKDMRPDRAAYVARGKPWWRGREEHQRIDNREDSQATEAEVIECHRYTYHKGQLVTNKKDDINEWGGTELQEVAERKDGIVLETGNTEALNRAEERSVGCEEPDYGTWSHELPKERPSSQDVPEKMEWKMPDAWGTFVQDPKEKVQDVPDIGMEEHQEAEKVSSAQEVPEKTFKIHEEVQDHREAVLISGGLNEVSKSLETLQVSEGIQEKEDEEEMSNLSGDPKERPERVVEKRTESEENLEVGIQDLEWKKESLGEPVPRAQDEDQSSAEDQKPVEETKDSHVGTPSKAVHHEVRTEDGMGKAENKSSAKDAVHDTGEDHRADIPEAAGPTKVQEDAAIESKADNRFSPSARSSDGNGEIKLERHGDDVQMGTTSAHSNANASSVDGDINNKMDDNVQEVSGSGFTETTMPGSHRTSDRAEEKDQSVTELSKTSIRRMQTGAEDPAGKDEDQKKMLEQIMTEIIAHVSEKDVHIQPLVGDFSEFAETQVDLGRFGHIIELYDFSSTLSTQDLMEPFLEYRDRGFSLEWVDQTHALGIFSSPEEAYAASRRTHPAMKFRPLSQGSRQSKIRAYEKTVPLQPYKERPQTDASVAKRMVKRALEQQKEEADPSVKE